MIWTFFLIWASLFWISSLATTEEIQKQKSNLHNSSPVHQITYEKCPYLLPSLDKLVHQNLSRTRVFVTYHNDIGERAIRHFSCNYTRKWVVTVFCNATKYFEYYAYKELSKLSMEGDLKDVDYVLMTGYKTLAPREWGLKFAGTGVYIQEDFHIQTILEFALKNQEYDVIPFFVPLQQVAVAQGLPLYHTKAAVHALVETLKAMQWTDSQISKSLWAIELYRNTFLIKSKVFLQLAKEMATFFATIESNPSINKMYIHDSKYRGNVEVAMKAFGTYYYQLHCFVAERAIAVILDHLNANVSARTLFEMIQSLSHSRSANHKPDADCSRSLSALDELIHQNLSRTRVFVTYHDVIGERAIRHFSCNYTRKWVVPVFCNATKYFEYYAYKELSKLSMEGHLKDVDYVIMTGYRMVAPREWALTYNLPPPIQPLDISDIQTFIEFIKLNPSYDFIPIFPTQHSVMRGNLPLFNRYGIDTLFSTLRALNWNESEILNTCWSKEVMHNSYIAKVDTFLRLAKSIDSFITKIETDKKLEEMFHRPAKYNYGLDRELVRQIFGTSTLMLHPLVVASSITMQIDRMDANIYPYGYHAIVNEVQVYRKQINLMEYKDCSHSLPALDELIRQNLSRIRVFVTYHDDIGERAIRHFSCNYTRKWVVPVFCNATKYFEYYAYKELSKLSMEGDLKDVDYVLMTGYKTLAPREWELKYDRHLVYPTDDRRLLNLIYFALNHSEYDVIPLFPTRTAVIKRMTGTQGNQALIALKALLRAVNWTEAEMADSIWAHEVIRNTYLAKTGTFLRLASAMTSLIRAVERNGVLEKKFQHRAQTEGYSSQLAMKVFGTPYYQLYEGVMESAVSVVLDHLKSKVSSERFDL